MCVGDNQGRLFVPCATPSRTHMLPERGSGPFLTSERMTKGPSSFGNQWPNNEYHQGKIAVRREAGSVDCEAKETPPLSAALHQPPTESATHTRR